MSKKSPVNRNTRPSSAGSLFLVCLMSVATVACFGCSGKETSSGSMGSSKKEVLPDQPAIQKNNDPDEMLVLETLATKDELFRWSLEIESKAEKGLYAFKEEDFEFPYSLDMPNQGKQSMKDYMGWIPSFYDGNLLSSGWNSNAKERVGDLESKTVTSHFNVIGRVIAAEWAKDNGGRRISTSDLKTLSKMLTATGSEKELLKQLQDLAVSVHGKLSE